MAAKIPKKIWMPLAVTVLCAAIIAVVLVFTLPRKKESGKMHVITETPLPQVTRGELQISLIRERLHTYTLNRKGLQVHDEFGTAVDFSDRQDNIFGINRNILVAPESYFEADIAISNKKPYAFEYWLEIVPDDGESLLAGQQELTVTVGGETVVSESLSGGIKTEPFPIVESGQVARFTVKLEYKSTKDNNETKNSTLAFDMVVHARLTAS